MEVLAWLVLFVWLSSSVGMLFLIIPQRPTEYRVVDRLMFVVLAGLFTIFSPGVFLIAGFVKLKEEWQG